MLFSSFSLIFLAGATSASFQDFGIPASHATVDVRVFNTGKIALVETTHVVVHPVLPGRETITFPVYAFLVEHNGERLLWDLGVRNDPQNAVPGVAKEAAEGGFSFAGGKTPKDIAELLVDGGIPLASIKTVIWRQVALVGLVSSLC